MSDKRQLHGSLNIIGIPTFKEFLGKGQGQTGTRERGRKTKSSKTEIL